jgi:hypothetical protein
MSAPVLGTSELQMNLDFYGLSTNSQTLQLPTITNTSSIMAQNQVSLVTGSNAVPVPVGAQGVVIVVPNNNTQDIKLAFANNAEFNLDIGYTPVCVLPMDPTNLIANLYFIAAGPAIVSLFWL